MEDDSFGRAVAAAYEAAADPAAWSGLGVALRGLVGAADVSLLVPDPRTGALTPLIGTASPALARAYGQHLHRHDPFRAHAEDAWTRLGAADASRTILGGAVIPEERLIRTEFYADYLRPMGRHHMLGGLLGRTQPSPLGLYRPRSAEPFGDAQRRHLDRFLPHLQRALDLAGRLDAARHSAGIGLAALDALAPAAIVLDVARHPVFVNAGAEAVLAAGNGLRLARAGGPLGDSVVEAAHPGDRPVLERLVAAVAAGGAGGPLRLRRTGRRAVEEPVLALVSPMPARFANGGTGTAAGLALLTLRAATRRDVTAAALATAFGLSAAEAEVAATIVRGDTLEEAARRRGVGLETVRSQAKAVLRKSGTRNLRDFAHVAGQLAEGGPGRPPR